MKPIMCSCKAAIVLAAMSAGVSAGPIQGPSSPEWPQLGFDAERTSFNPNETKLSPVTVGDLEVAWSNGVPCTINRGVSVANDIVYYGHYCGEFLAVRADTGATIWTQGLVGVHTGQSVINGVVYVSARCTYTECGRVYAFDAATGAPLWSWDAGSRHAYMHVVADGVVYVSALGTSSDLYALDAATGAELWNVSPGGNVAVAGGVVYRSSGTTLQALSAADGSILWTGLTGGGIVSQPGVADGVVYVHTDAGELHAFDAGGCGQATCSPLWTGLTQMLPPPPLEAYLQPPAVGEGHVYVGAGDTMYAFDAAGCGSPSCPPVWTTGTECLYFPYAPPSVANGVVYSACGPNRLYAFDAATGYELWKFATSATGSMRTSPAIVDGRVFHPATFSFKLYAFELLDSIFPYGCGVNPKGSMVAIGGAAVPGGTVYLGLDNPLGTQAAGSATFLAVAGSPDPSFPCGTLLPGFGMRGPGATGELLIVPQTLSILAGAPWLGPGTPAPVAVPLPPLPTIVGMSIYAQGMIVDTSPGASVVFGLTDAAEIQIGS